MLAGGGVLAALVVAWLAAAAGPLALFVHALEATAAGAAALTAVPVAAKWLLIGRARPQVIPLWSPAHLRLWTVSTLTRLAPPVAMVGSPLYNAYLRALGARIEPGAVIFSRTVPVAADLLTVGPDAVIGKRASFTGYRPGRDPATGLPVIWTGPITVGARATVGAAAYLDPDTSVGDLAHLAHASALHHAQHIPLGAHWHGSPAQPAHHRPETPPSAELTRGRRARYAAGQLAAALLGLPLLLTVAAWAVKHYPALVTVLDPAAQPGAGFAAHAAQVSLQLFVAGLVLGLAAVVLVPRALVGVRHARGGSIRSTGWPTPPTGRSPRSATRPGSCASTATAPTSWATCAPSGIALPATARPARTSEPRCTTRRRSWSRSGPAPRSPTTSGSPPPSTATPRSAPARSPWAGAASSATP